MNDVRSRTIDSPVGPLTLAGDGKTITNLRMTDQTHPPPDQAGWSPQPSAFPDAVEQLLAYFEGELTEFDLALDMRGTAFQRGSGTPSPRSPTARPSPTGSSPGGSGSPEPPGPSGWPTGTTPSPSSFPVTG